MNPVSQKTGSGSSVVLDFFISLLLFYFRFQFWKSNPCDEYIRDETLKWMEQHGQLLKVKNDIFLVVDNEVRIRSLVLWLFLTQICLFASNVHYVLLFSLATVMLLCFLWVHFLWCGCVCTYVLMDVDQGFGRDKEDKRSYKEERQIVSSTSFWDD